MIIIADNLKQPTPHDCLSTKTGRPVSFEIEIYLVLQSISCTATCVATSTGELLPHLFTLIRQLPDGYFLLHYYTLAGIFPLGSMAPCIARTFLLCKAAID